MNSSEPVSFFDHEQVQGAMLEIETLTQSMYALTKIIADNDPNGLDVISDYYYTLYALIDKSHNLYVRLSLDDSEETSRMQSEMRKNAREMGMKPGQQIGHYYGELKEGIKLKIRELTGEDLDLEVDLSWSLWVPDMTLNCGKSEQSN